MRIKYFIFIFVFLMSFYTYSETILCREFVPPLEVTFNAKVLTDDLILWGAKNKLLYDYARVANEQNLNHFSASMRKKGALVGLGGDQLYTLAGMARSEGLWVYDMDSRVLAIHHLMRIALLNAESPDAFIKFFAKLGDKSLIEENRLFLAKYFDNPKFVQLLLDLLLNSKLATHFNKVSLQQDKLNQNYTFLGVAEAYQHVRGLALNDKIHILFGSHMDTKLLSQISSEVKGNNLQVADLYISNSNELRWLIPDELGFFLSLSNGADRSDVYELVNRLDQQVSELELNKDLAKRAFLLKNASHTIEILNLKLMFINGALQNADQLISNLKLLPYYSDSQILTTSLEVFNMLKIAPNISIKEDENIETYKFTWNYSSFNASALANTNQTVSQEFLTIAERTTKLLDRFSSLSKP